MFQENESWYCTQCGKYLGEVKNYKGLPKECSCHEKTVKEVKKRKTKYKYLLLNELNFELVNDDGTSSRLIFDTKKEAKEYAKKYVMCSTIIKVSSLFQDDMKVGQSVCLATIPLHRGQITAKSRLGMRGKITEVFDEHKNGSYKYTILWSKKDFKGYIGSYVTNKSYQYLVQSHEIKRISEASLK